MDLVITIRKNCLFALALLFIAGLFIKSPWIINLMQIMLLIVLALSLLDVKGTSRIIGFLLFLAGAVLMVIYHAEAAQWLEGVSRNLYLVVMFTLVPLLAIPIRSGGYMQELQAFFRHHVREDRHFYLFVNLITFLVAVMVNVAAIPLLHQICQASDKSKNVKLLSTAIVRGFSASIIWAPSYAATALVLELTGARWMDFFPYGLIIGILALLPGLLLVSRENRGYVPDVMASSQEGLIDENQPQWKKIVELSFFGLLLLVGIVFTSSKTGITTVTVVSLAALCFPLLWMFLIKRIPQFVSGVKEQYYDESLGKLSNEVVLFLGAGFFATAVSFSHLGDLVPQLISLLVHNNALGLALVVITVTTVLGIVGVHPIITVTVVGSTVNPQAFNISPTFMALILTSSWAMGVVTSPSSGVNISMAGLIDKSVDIGPRWNTWYAFLTIGLIITVLWFFKHFGL